VNAQGWQDDCDFDGFGDSCDGDLNNSGEVNGTDFVFFGKSFNKSVGDPAFNACADMNASGAVNGTDYVFFGKQQLNGVPGPSGLKCASLVPGSGNLTGKNRCWFLPNHRVKCSPSDAQANDQGILTNPVSGRDLRFINKRHYANLSGPAGGHCGP
jgi:hypothetical protein